METFVSGINSQRGTLPWTAPEIIRTPDTVTEKVDIYRWVAGGFMHIRVMKQGGCGARHMQGWGGRWYKCTGGAPVCVGGCRSPLLPLALLLMCAPLASRPDCLPVTACLQLWRGDVGAVDRQEQAACALLPPCPACAASAQ
jgi:hypothetical protein